MNKIATVILCEWCIQIQLNELRLIKLVAISARYTINTENLQLFSGWIFHTFSTKFLNFTTFKMYFQEFRVSWQKLCANDFNLRTKLSLTFFSIITSLTKSADTCLFGCLGTIWRIRTDIVFNIVSISFQVFLYVL